jgi:hypothetical protein
MRPIAHRATGVILRFSILISDFPIMGALLSLHPVIAAPVAMIAAIVANILFIMLKFSRVHIFLQI